MDTSPATSRTAPDPPRPSVPEMSLSGGNHRGLATRLSAGLAVATVLAQISYPLLSGDPLRLATIGAVLLFTAASLTHAVSTRGRAAALRLLVVAGGIGLLAEAVGVSTGIPFGGYAYAGTLGPAVLGVPVIVPLAWTMMAYPCLLLGRRLAHRVAPHGGPAGRLATVATGGFTLAAWDLSLDPQMVAAGHWTWDDPTPGLPGVPGIPLTNYAGWLLVATVMIAVLDRALPRAGRTEAGRTEAGRTEAVPAALLTWTWLGSALANLAFFDRPAVAGYVVVTMGLTVMPYLRLLLADRSPEGRP